MASPVACSLGWSNPVLCFPPSLVVVVDIVAVYAFELLLPSDSLSTRVSPGVSLCHPAWLSCVADEEKTKALRGLCSHCPPYMSGALNLRADNNVLVFCVV